MPAALLADVFAQKLMRSRIEDANVKPIPLHFDELPDPAWRKAVVGRFHFNATVQMHRAFAVLVITEWFNRQRKQRRFFFREHRRNLPLCRAVDARIGPPQLPLIEIGLSFFQAFETESLEWCFLRVSDTRFHLPFAIGIFDPARHRRHAVVREHFLEQWVQDRIVKIGS